MIIANLQVAMKLSRFEREELARRLVVARERCPQSDVEIGREAGVHPSQVGRICRGDFRTLSHNVVQICKTLEIPYRNLNGGGQSSYEKPSEGWPLLEKAVSRAWDRTPAGARRLAHAIEAIAALSVRSRRRKDGRVQQR